MASFDELGGFDANQVAPSSFDVLPAGEYDVVIVGSQMKPTKDRQGKYLELEMQVLNGEHQNRKVFDNLNLFNQSAKAVEIARGTLSAICRAVNVMTPKDSSELHNKPLRIKVAVNKSDEYGEQNKVKAYKPRHVAPPVQPVQQPAYPAATPAQVGAQPW